MKCFAPEWVRTEKQKRGTSASPIFRMKEMRMQERKCEHPYGDAGQLILLGLFLVVWAGDSFFLHKSTFVSDYVPLSIRLVILGLALIIGVYLFKSGHVVVSHEERPTSVVSTGACPTRIA